MASVTQLSTPVAQFQFHSHLNVLHSDQAFPNHNDQEHQTSDYQFNIPITWTVHKPIDQQDDLSTIHTILTANSSINASTVVLSCKS